MATSTQPSATVSSKYVEGTTVYDLHGKKIGKISHLVIQKSSGRVLWVVVNVSDFVGIGHSHRQVPWSGLHYDTHLNGYRIDPSASETHLR